MLALAFSGCVGLKLSMILLTLQLINRSFYFNQTLAATHMEDKELTESIQRLLVVMQRLDAKIAPLLERDGEHFNRRLVLESFDYSEPCMSFLLIQDYKLSSLGYVQ